MSSMDSLIAEYFATDNGTSDLEKQAQGELFAKLAADNGIDLEKLSQEQIAYLWNETFAKTAGDDDEDKKKKEEQEEEAKKEHEEKRAGAAKLAEAEYIGRYMAHAMTDEIRKIASAGDLLKTADKRSLGQGLKDVGHRVGELLGGSRAQSLKAEAEKNVGKGKDMARRLSDPNASEKVKQLASGIKQRAEHNAGEAVRGHKEEAKKVLLARLTAGGATAAAAGGTAAAIHHHNKKASALDELAAVQAIVKAAEAGHDIDQASERIDAVLTLGVDESEKIAYVQDLESAVDIRSLELLEAAGYPVTWES